MFVSGLRRDSRAAVSIIFATTIIPLAMSVGLAVDYSFFIQCQSQLSLAADAGAIHAVRIASANFIAGQTSAQADTNGGTAGVQWFNAQLGTLNTGTILPADIHISVAYDAATSKFTSVVTYKATVPTHFGGLFKLYSWPVYGVANAVITTNSYVEIAMLLDNSSSMLIGSTPADVESLQKLTACPPTATAAATGHLITEYSWNFPANVSYSNDPPGGPAQSFPSITSEGNCDPYYHGDINECPYPMSLGKMALINNVVQCPVGTGTPTPIVRKGVTSTVNVPSAPCGFACHTPLAGGAPDYYTLARNQTTYPKIVLRFDVIQNAVAQIISTLQSKEQVSNQFSVGIFAFNSGVSQIHPAPTIPFVEADSQLSQAQTDVVPPNFTTPSVIDQANTNFAGAAQLLAANFKPTGDGSTPATPRKNLFIITDGLQDWSPTVRFIGGMTAPAPGVGADNCAPLKALGITIYVLYTPYFPLPNPFYLNNGNQTARLQVEVQPPATISNIAAGLQGCATTPQQFYQASSAADINTALLQMLQSALNTPGRISL